MTILAAVLAIGLFTWGLSFFGVIRVGTGAVATTRDAVAVMRDSELDEDAREKAVQSASVKLLGTFFSIFARSAVTLAVSFIPIGLMSLAGLLRVDEVLVFLSRWDVIIVATLVILAFYFARSRLCPTR